MEKSNDIEEESYEIFAGNNSLDYLANLTNLAAKEIDDSRKGKNNKGYKSVKRLAEILKIYEIKSDTVSELQSFPYLPVYQVLHESNPDIKEWKDLGNEIRSLQKILEDIETYDNKQGLIETLVKLSKEFSAEHFNLMQYDRHNHPFKRYVA